MASVRSENLKELRRITAELRKGVAVRAVESGQAVLVGGLQRRVPVRTGKLRGTIKALKVVVRVKRVRGKVTAGGKTRQGIAQEYGTAHNRAHPYWYPTLRIDGPRAESAMMEVMDGA
jgi:hypothetical protein